jgi:Adenylate and Guanylate cyclase catalytic domain
LLGYTDMHETAYSDTAYTFPIETYRNNETISAPGHCVYTITLYFSNKFKSESSNHLALISSLTVVAVFLFMAAAFCMYDRFVRRRNDKIIGEAARSNGIIASLFPSQIRDRLFAESERPKVRARSTLKDEMQTDGLLGETAGNDEEDSVFKSVPIADLFPETSILFADIAGFTAWSSVREPKQVFMLLETLFHSFDKIARRRRVFKVGLLYR